ncbi:MAG: glycogen synthase [Clostridia bacterium]|nr:glycogen synthase [Clostridia bacterium]
MKKILFVGSEAAPFAATGGLGDVLGSLPKEIAAAGGENVDVRVVLPLHAMVKDEYRAEMKTEAEFTVALAWRRLYCGIKSLKKDGVTWYFIDNEQYFKRTALYGQFDDGERYAFFSTAVLQMMQVLNFYPDYMHANDWQSALTVIYAKRKYAFVPEYSGIRSVFTIHNIEYQGIYDFAILGDVFDLHEADRSFIENDGCINLMKGAIQLCDILTTVSPRYAGEIQSAEFAHGLQSIISANAYKLRGILNGIDYISYDPKTDKALAKNFTYRSVKNKAENKTAFQEMMHLPVNADIPMYAMITRLATHKGIDIVCAMIERLLCEDVQFVLLGTGDGAYEEFFRDLEGKYRDKVRSLIMFDRDISRKLYAAADFFIMPSKSEPCGLSQMIASRYGTVPITRETGGLADSIHGYYEENGKLCGNGFTFANYSAEELLDRALAAKGLYADKEKFEKFVSQIMRVDFSWARSANEYLDMYQV